MTSPLVRLTGNPPLAAGRAYDVVPGEFGELPALPRGVPSRPFTILSMLRIWLEGDEDVVDTVCAAVGVVEAEFSRTTSRLVGDGDRRGGCGAEVGDVRLDGEVLRLRESDGDLRAGWWWRRSLAPGKAGWLWWRCG